MKPEELAVYRGLTKVAAYGQGVTACFLCGQDCKVGERLLMVPTDCAETEKMHAGQPYNHRLAHRSCMERVP